MVAIPVRLYKAARRERVRFRHVYAPEPEPEVEIEEPPLRGALRHFPAPATPPVPPPIESREVEEDEPEMPSSVSRVRESVVGAEDAKPVPRESILKGFETSKDEYVVFKPSEIAALRPRTSTELPILEFVHGE
jgi:non-homologous end joining protein Ku